MPLLLAGWYLKWFRLNLTAFLGFLVFLSCIYALIYLFNYLAIRKDIQKINIILPNFYHQ
ncbi:DUF3021 family protein [Streptococcus orisratti]|uniref:DUF3021 family protein n=1 Tax=Streptococcus orisratti TaxID=114652 RepID=UPI002942A4C8|nr:DUF3021 family protein [Streptococcus orisratti]